MGTGDGDEPEKALGATLSVGNVNGSDTSSSAPAEVAVDAIGVLASDKAERESEEVVADEGEVGGGSDIGIVPEPFDFERSRGGLTT